MPRYGRFARWILCLIGLALIGANGLFGLEPPSKLDLLKARIDGTLAAKLAFAKSLGNHLVEPGLAAEFENRLARLRLKSLGRTDAEIDRILPALPSGIRPGLKSKGTSKIFALLIDFPDYPSTNSTSSINGKLFGDGESGYPRESLRNYYRRSSYNQLEIQGATLGWYRPAYSRASVTQTYVGRENLIKEALNSINSAGHDFAQYDNDGDGDIDYFVVIWTGPAGRMGDLLVGLLHRLVLVVRPRREAVPGGELLLAMGSESRRRLVLPPRRDPRDRPLSRPSRPLRL